MSKAAAEEARVKSDADGPTPGHRGRFVLRRIVDLVRAGLVPVILVCITTPDAVLHQKLFKMNMIAGNIVHHYVGR